MSEHANTQKSRNTIINRTAEHCAQKRREFKVKHDDHITKRRVTPKQNSHDDNDMAGY